MITQDACNFLGCSSKKLNLAYDRGELRKSKLPDGRVNWDEGDLRRMAGHRVDRQFVVAYARVDPRLDHRQFGTTEHRLQEQKDRLTAYCKQREFPADVVIGEARPVNRVRTYDGVIFSGFSALTGLIAQGRVSKLVIDSIDRINVGGSWEMFLRWLPLFGGTEVVVLNTTHATKEIREESKYWMADLLQQHKAHVGEIRDEAILRQYMGGYDLGITPAKVRKAERMVDAERNRARKAIRLPQPVDLSEVFE